MPETRLTGTRAAGAAAAAAAVHVLLDWILRRVTWTTPPYLLLEYAREPFRDLVQVDATALLVGASVASSAINGIVAALFGYALLERRRHRVLALGLLLSGLWMLSGGVLALVYLSVPGGRLAASLLAGVPRSLAVAWVVVRVMRPGPDAGGALGDEPS